MAETIARTDLPADPKERRAALNAMLKPLIDRAVAACGEARQAALRSDEAGAKARQRSDRGRLLVGAAQGHRQSLGARVCAASAHRL